jgi:hypothetical protein
MPMRILPSFFAHSEGSYAASLSALKILLMIGQTSIAFTYQVALITC